MTWRLKRKKPYPYIDSPGLAIDGLAMLPAEDLGMGLTEAYVLSQLNTKNCFDFDYTPIQGDELTIEAPTGMYRDHRFMAFEYDNMGWRTFFPHVSPDPTSPISNGKLKIIGSKE